MKKIAIALALIAQLLAAGVVYPETMVITSMDKKTDVVTLETSNGNIYEMTGCEDYNVGDVVSMVMYDSATPKVQDDVILSAKWSGFTVRDISCWWRDVDKMAENIEK